jgi:hypothetical protein
MSTAENKQLIQDAFTTWANGDGRKVLGENAVRSPFCPDRHFSRV